MSARTPHLIYQVKRLVPITEAMTSYMSGVGFSQSMVTCMLLTHSVPISLATMPPATGMAMLEE